MDLGRTVKEYKKYRHGYPQKLLERLKKYEIGISGQKILDIGTSNGLFARDLARNGCEVIGIDLSPELIEQAKQINSKDKLPIEYLRGNVEDLPFENDSIEIVTAAYSWHWFNKLKVAVEVERVLKRDGKLVIINYDWLPQNKLARYTEGLILEFNQDGKRKDKYAVYPEWIEEIVSAGFTDIETFSFDVNVSYSVETWIGRIQASPDIGRTLSIEETKLFNKKLETFLNSEVKQETFNIPYRIFTIIGVK